MRRIFNTILAVATGAVLFTSCSKEQGPAAVTSFNDFVKSRPELSIYDSALNHAGLQLYRNGSGPFTFFAPTNDAFTAAGLTLDSISRMTSGALNYYLMYHIVNAQVTTTDMVGAQFSFPRGTQIGNTGATQVFLGRKGDSSFLNGFRFVNADNQVSNGVIHIIDRLHVPPVLKGSVQSILSATGQHSLFIAALTRANRWTALATSTNIVTIFAPTDAAMNAGGLTTTAINAMPVTRLDSIVRYHYISSSRLFVNDLGDRETPQTALGINRTLTASGNGTMIKGKGNATPVNIVDPNTLGLNGVVHVIDGVLRY